MVKLRPLIGRRLQPEAFRSVRTIGVRGRRVACPSCGRGVRGRAVLLAAVTILYPFIVYFLGQRFGPRLPGRAAAGARAAAFRRPRRDRSSAGRRTVAALLARGQRCCWTTASRRSLYPVAVNLGLLAVFGYSLFHPPTVVERLARLREPELPPPAIAYTRRGHAPVERVLPRERDHRRRHRVPRQRRAMDAVQRRHSLRRGRRIVRRRVPGPAARASPVA